MNKNKIDKLDRNETSEEQMSEAVIEMEKAMLKLEPCQVFYICPDEMKRARIDCWEETMGEIKETAIDWRMIDLCNFGRNIKYRCDDFNDIADFLNDPYPLAEHQK